MYNTFPCKAMMSLYNHNTIISYDILWKYELFDCPMLVNLHCLML